MSWTEKDAMNLNKDFSSDNTESPSDNQTVSTASASPVDAALNSDRGTPPSKSDGYDPVALEDFVGSKDAAATDSVHYSSVALEDFAHQPQEETGDSKVGPTGQTHHPLPVGDDRHATSAAQDKNLSCDTGVGERQQHRVDGVRSGSLAKTTHVPQANSLWDFISANIQRISPERVEIEGHLGAGGYSQVLKGTLDGTTKVAIKVPAKRGSTEDVLYEAARAASVEHPFVLPVLGLVERDGKLSLVTPLCQGGSLQDVLRVPSRQDRATAEPLPLSHQFRVLLHIASGLECMHEKGIIHKDLKSTNVFLTDKDLGITHALLADMGVAQTDALMLHAGEQETKDVAKGIKDMHWCSPEEARGKKAGFSSDIFSWALIAIHVITRREPWRGFSSNNEWLRCLRRGDPATLLRDVEHSPFLSILKKCVVSEPTLRPTASALVSLLCQTVEQCYANTIDGRVSAAHAIKEYRVTLLTHASRHQRAFIVPVAAAKSSTTVKVPEDFRFSFQQGGTAGRTEDAEEMSLVLDRFLSSEDRWLGIVADGGMGKSITLEKLALERKHAFPLRQVMSPEQWRCSALRDGIKEALSKGYGLSDAVIDAMRDRPHVFLVDGLDEMFVDEEWSSSRSEVLSEHKINSQAYTLLDHLGFTRWPQAKIILASRCSVLNAKTFTQLIGPESTGSLRYLLPFNKDQVLHYLSRHSNRKRDAAPFPATPLLLSLYADLPEPSDGDVFDRDSIIEGTERNWIESLKRRLLASLPSALSAFQDDLGLSFRELAMKAALCSFDTGTPFPQTQSDWWGRIEECVVHEAESTYRRHRDTAGPQARQLLSCAEYVKLHQLQLRRLARCCPVRPVYGGSGAHHQMVYVFRHNITQDFYCKMGAKALSMSPRSMSADAAVLHGWARFSFANSMWGTAAAALGEAVTSAQYMADKAKHADILFVAACVAQRTRKSDPLPLLDHCLQLRQALFPPDHPLIAEVLDKRGLVIGGEDSVKLFLETAEIFKRHRWYKSYAKTQRNLGDVYSTLGRSQEAATCLNDAYNVQCLYLGYFHRDTARTIFSFALMYWRDEQLDQAGESLSKLTQDDGILSLFNSNHEELAIARYAHAFLLCKTGRDLEEADRLFSAASGLPAAMLEPFFKVKLPKLPFRQYVSLLEGRRNKT